MPKRSTRTAFKHLRQNESSLFFKPLFQRFFHLLLLLSLSPAMPAQAGQLGELLQETLRHPRIEAAKSDVGAAAAQRDAATSRYLGQGELSAGWHRYEGPRVVGTFVPGTVPLLSEDLFQYGVNYRLPVDVFGVIGAARERARHDLAGARLLARQETLLRLHQTSSAYLRLLALRRQDEALKQLRKQVESTAERLRQAVAVGRSAAVEARYADSELARVQAEEAALQEAEASARADLADASGAVPIVLAASRIPVPAWDDQSGGTTLPVRLAREREASARAHSREARRGLLPSLSLDAYYLRHHGGGFERDTWALGGQLAFPLDVSRIKTAEASALSARAASQRAAAEERESARRQTTLRAAYDSALADARAAEQETAYRREVAVIQREMYRLGKQTLENLFQHERDLLTAEYRLAQARLRAAEAWSAAQVLNGIDANAYIARMDDQ